MKKTTLAIFGLLISLLLITGCSANPSETATAAETTTSRSIVAEGSLQPVNSLTQSFMISGQVAEVLVKNGEKVEKGQVLARLESSPEAKLALENAQLEALSAQQALDTLVTSADLALAQAQLELANAQKNYDKIRWNQLRADQARETNEDQINAARAAVVIAKDKVDDAEERYNDFSETADTDPLKAAALSALSNARLNLDQAEFDLNFYLNPPDQKDLAISAAEVALAKAKFDEAQRKVEDLQNGPDPDELAMAKARLDSANAAVENAQAKMDALELKSTLSGTVVDLTLQPGQKIAAGEAAVMVADFSNWIIKTDDLTENDVPKIAVDQKVSVSLDALPDITLEGVVTQINSLFLENRGDVTYTVTVQLTELDERMRWGMTAAVFFEE